MAVGLVGAAAAAPLYPPLKPVWSFAAAGGFYNPPVVADGILYLGGVDGTVYALGADGQPVWKHALGGQVYAGVAVDEQSVYAASTDKTVVALDRQRGVPRWKATLDGVIYAAPRLMGGALVVGTGDTGKVYCLDAATGQEKWRFPLGKRLGSGLAVADGLAFLPSYDMHLYAVEVATGLLKWQFVANRVIDSTPLVHGDKLYLKLPSDRICCLNRATGEVLWQGGGVLDDPVTEPTNWSPLVVDQGRLLYGSLDGRLHAVTEEKGEPVWISAFTIPRPAPPVCTGEVGFAGGKDGGLEAIDLATGTLLWSWLPEKEVAPGLVSGIMWPPVVVGTRLYAASMDGNLYAFEANPDKAAWEAYRKTAPAPVKPPEE